MTTPKEKIQSMIATAKKAACENKTLCPMCPMCQAELEIYPGGTDNSGSFFPASAACECGFRLCPPVDDIEGKIGENGWDHMFRKQYIGTQRIKKAIAQSNPTAFITLAESLLACLEALEVYAGMDGGYCDDNTRTIFDPLGYTAREAIAQVEKKIGAL